MLPRYLTGRAAHRRDRTLRHRPANPHAGLMKVLRLQVSADGTALVRRPLRSHRIQLNTINQQEETS